MLYLIGLGLGDAEDISCKGLAVIQRASRVYLEAYTSVLTVGTEALVSEGHRVSGCFAPLPVRPWLVCPWLFRLACSPFG